MDSQMSAKERRSPKLLEWTWGKYTKTNNFAYDAQKKKKKNNKHGDSGGNKVHNHTLNT